MATVHTLFTRLSQTMRPARCKALLALLPLTLGSASGADEYLTLAQVATCSFQSDNEIFSKANRTLEGVPKTDDGYRFDGPVRFGTLCIENAQLKGAFGVLGVSGSLCTDDPKPLVDFAEAATGGMTQREHPPMPGVIGAYEAPKYMLVIYRGEPAFEMKPDPASKRISYFCYYRGSGPQ